MNCAGYSGVITASLVEIVSIGPVFLARTCGPGPVSSSDSARAATENTGEFNATKWRMELAVTTKLTTNSTARELAQQLKFKAWCSNPSASANSNSKQRGQLIGLAPSPVPRSVQTDLAN